MQITKYQLGIIENLPSSAMYIMFNIRKNIDINFSFKILQKLVDGRNTILGFGENLFKMFKIPNCKNFTRNKFNNTRICDHDGYDLVFWLRDNDKGEIFHRAMNIKNALNDYFSIKKVVSGYNYNNNFDLSGFKKNIKNPKDVLKTAIISEGDLEGSSFWVLQQWMHNFNWLNNNSQARKEECIGISLDDSYKLENLKNFAHIKKISNTNYIEKIDILRRSMSWSDNQLNGGLMFSGFATSFKSFNSQMNTMLGNNDGITDGIFNFSKIIETNYLWCPPFKKGRLHLCIKN